MIKGVLFDMDGVLVDSEAFICQAGIMMFAEYGITAKPADFHPFTGMGENRYIGGVAALYGLDEDIVKIKNRTYEIYSELVKGRLTSLPGAVDFIDRCRRKGLKLALATSADTVKMLVNLKEIGIPPETFDSIVTGLDVENKKPFPDIYIRAAENIGLNTAECLVVEDAVSGVRAGKTAGCRCLALTTSFSKTDLAEADWICSTLSEAPDEVLNW